MSLGRQAGLARKWVRRAGRFLHQAETPVTESMAMTMG
jgi:hypothetical protein